jgi:hypothetical protein
VAFGDALVFHHTKGQLLSRYIILEWQLLNGPTFFMIKIYNVCLFVSQSQKIRQKSITAHVLYKYFLRIVFYITIILENIMKMMLFSCFCF